MCPAKQLVTVAVLFSLISVVCPQMSTTERPGQRRVTIPPLIVEEPLQEMAFRVGESLEMPCIARGEPNPTYSWQMNEQFYDPSGTDGRVATQPGVGTLIFARPIERDEALYQCFAVNPVGTAITVKINLRQAYLETFQSSSIITHRPNLGHPQTLRCIPPRSYPKGDIFWATLEPGQNFKAIDLSDRVTIDPEGNLHLVHVIQDDYQDGRTYTCVVQNTVMRGFQQGAYAKINPQGTYLQTLAPEIMWTSPNHQVATRGEIWRVKCIFSGNPTPRVDWARIDGELPSRARKDSFGQELVVENVQYEDAGKYECQGINDEIQTPIRRSFDLKIEAKPMWIRRPESVDAAEFDQAVFYCEADGLPEPNFFWFINGVPLEKVPADPRRIAEKNRLTFLNMTKEDAQVIQCNSTNKHGYIFANAYLNVLTEPATILTPPTIGQKAAEEQTIVLTCQVFGSPKPLVVWRKGTEQLTGGRYKVLPDGHLEIMDVSLVDSGSYTCSASNVYGSDSATGSLIVRRKTRIQTKPLDVMVYEETEAKFTCTATTDVEEVQNLKIEWKKDGEIIDYQLAQRLFKNDLDNSLTISGTINLDTGKYTCMASNGLDSDETSAQLIVQGPPDPPNNVIVRCTNNQRKAEIEWQPGRENYAPILNYIIQFNTTFAQDTWIDIASNVSQNERRMVVTLSPWGNYTFRVLARNKIGLSYPSEHTSTICRTEPDLPTKNPENVIGEGDLPNNLVIFWTPMPKIEQNGPGFKYILTYKRMDIQEDEESFPVDQSDAWHQVIELNNIPPYTPYLVSVKASNSNGESTVTPRQVQGFSGEAEPIVVPENIRVDTESVTDSTIVLRWDQVDTDPEMVQGFFRGYRIQFARSSEWPEGIREDDYIINEPPYYPRPRVKRQTVPEVVYTLRHLPPYSEITLQMRVLNKYYAGPPSEQITFTSQEGEPGPPSLFDVTAQGPTHFELMWRPPYERNGILIGYNISYQTITGLNLGRLQYREPINDPDATMARLTGLQPDTFYRVYLAAATIKGTGEPIFLDTKTSPSEPPNAPTFAIVSLNDTYVHLTWEPSRNGNPGSVFYVQYRVRGGYHWLHSPDEYMEYSMYIYDLNPGTTYQIRVVAKNGINLESPSEWQEFTTEGVAPGHYDLKASAWFYGIFLSFLLIIVLLVLFIFFKRVTDKWWLEKEEDIADQVKHLQAEEAVRQMGLFNPYAETGSRDNVQGDMSYQADYHGGPAADDDDDDDEEEGSYSEEDSEDDGGFDKAGAPKSGYQPRNYTQPSAPTQGYAKDQPPSYRQTQGYPPPAPSQPASYSQQPAAGTAYPGVGYRGPSPVTSKMDLNRSKDSVDTFV